MAITETWLQQQDDAIRLELCLTGYKLIDFPRQGRSGGGIGLLYKESLRVTKVQNGAEESFEFCELLIQSSTSRKIRLVIVYRPHNSPNHQRVPISTFLREFSSYMEPIILTKEPLIIVGDFNIHVDIPTDTDAVKFLDLLDSLALFQHVTVPTHIHGHTLDLVLSRKMEDIIASPPSACHYISDHAAIRCHVAIGKSNYHVKKISFRKIKSIDIGNLTRDVGLTGLCERGKESPTNSLDLDAFVHDYNTTLSRVLDQHAPLKTKTVQSRPKVPWYSNEIAEAKRRRRKAEKRWKRTKLPADLNALKKHKNYVTYISTRAKRAFYTDFVSENSDDQRKLFRATRSLLIPNNTTLANDIGRYFDSKIRRIRGALDAAIATTNIETVTEDSVFKGDKELDHFEPLTTEEVMKLVMKSTKKSYPLDPMPTSLVIEMFQVLLPFITNIVNASLSLGHFPMEWKTALVVPRLKKPKQGTSLLNLRPVSNLKYLSKLTETAVCNQVIDHISQSGLYPILQSAYRVGHSTETALLKIQNDILSAMDKQRVTLLVLLDLSAAFDTIDHQVLLHRLQVTYGVTGTALMWFQSYLTGRKQRVCINGISSKDFELSQGVPQGSCLGPMLFTLYAGKLFEVVKSHLPDIHVYADDTQLYLSFKPDGGAAEADAITALQDCISDIRTWMVKDKLQLNDTKTEFLIIGTSVQLNKISATEIQIGSAKVSTVDSARNLGAWFDSNMNMTTHINNICQSVCYHLHNIRRIRKYLSFENRKTLVQATVLSRIDYCNSLLFGLPVVHLSKLQRLQNAAARLVCNISKYDHITPALIRLHWLPVQFRIEFKVAMLVYKCINGTAPQYLKDLTKNREISKYSLRSNKGILLVDNSAKAKKTLGDRAFVNAAPRVWNRLPLDIRLAISYDNFKSMLKTHFFRLAFYD